jgi:hypothetical protein
LQLIRLKWLVIFISGGGVHMATNLQLTTSSGPEESINIIKDHDHNGTNKGNPVNAAYVTNTPAGNITALNQQDVNNQLDNFAALGRVHVPVRQTVLYGRTSVVTGEANFLSTTSGLSVDLAATSVPLIIAFAYNFNNDYGQVDYIGKITADVSAAWSSLTANQSAIYLYIDRNISTGALTYGFSLLAPTYATIAPGAPSTDQHWFDLNTFYMKRWNGSAWEIKQRVFVGECGTNANSVTSVIAYSLRGQYDSGWFNVATNTEYTKTHNIGKIDDLILYGLIRQNSSSKARLINNVSSAGISGYSANDAGDIISVLGNNIYLKTLVGMLHPTLSSSSDTDHYPNNSLSGQSRLFVKRGW